MSRDPAADKAPVSNMPKNSHKITLVGAGLTGPLLAISLAQRGFPVQIFERRPDMRLTRASAGRSINLAVSTRGIHALGEAGLWDQMSRIIIPMKGRMMHSLAGELTFQPYGKNDTEVINSISRADLNVALMNAAEAQGVTIHFKERCSGMDWNTGAARFYNEETGRETTVESEVVIGTDGSASALRQDMQKQGGLNLSQEVLDYGYKELTIAAGPGGKHVLEPSALHIWPRGAYMLIALPNVDGTFACILFLPQEGPESFATLDSSEKAAHFFSERFADAVPLMPQLEENYAANPVGSMVTVKCAPWQVAGKVLLLGDAAHAIVPFFGQGMNCAFEDCTVFLDLLDHRGPNWPKLFQEFESVRKLNTDSIADMALENFVEMRDRVAHPRFLFRKKVELALEAKYPRHFVPKYAMVTFHRVPYSVAHSRGKIQDRLLAELCDPIARIEDLDWKKADLLIQRDLTPWETLSVSSVKFESGRDFAQAMTASDPLAPYRDRFHIPKTAAGSDCVYLCGHSLGLQPKSARAYIEQELQDWERLGVEGHFHAKDPWMPYHEILAAPTARLVGALPAEVVVMNSLTVNLHLMMVSFYRPTPTRHKILIESSAFPSDQYAVQSQIAFHGFDPAGSLLEIAPRPGKTTIRTEDIEKLIAEKGQQTALILLGGVNYYTGQAFDCQRITEAGHAQGCIVAFDMAHAAGNLQLHLHDWKVDFAVWCSYKYLNGGPGCVAGCFVHERHARNQKVPRFAGWWGHDKNSRFQMPSKFQPIPGAEGWQLSNPSILSMAALRASMEIFDEATIARLRAKSETLTAYLEFLLAQHPNESFSVLTPRDRSQRGAQLSLQIRKGGRAVCDRLAQQGIICDWREPDILRVAPVPLYNSFTDVHTFADKFLLEVKA